MRPAILYPLFTPITSLNGVGPRLGGLYKKLCGEHIVDLLWYLPTGVIDRSYKPQLKHADRDRIVTLAVTILEHSPPQKRHHPYRIIGADDTDQIVLTYFNVKGDYLNNLYPLNHKIMISGTLERYRGMWVMNHPDYAVPPERASEIPSYEPVYPMTAGLGGKSLRRTIHQALAKAPVLQEWHDMHLLAREKWPNWREAVVTAHNLRARPPDTTADLREEVRRLAYDELLADQLALSIIRSHHKKMSGRSLQGNGSLIQKLEKSLPFTLTRGQRQAFAEISSDMKEPKRMLRLLQGDVGAGKTIVALMAMLQSLEADAQAALMAPTEILAKQHHAKLSQLLKPLGLEIGLIIGRSRLPATKNQVSGSMSRPQTLEALASGQLKMVVGTHALFQDDVLFHNLGLAVVDEQHRFGVNQRLLLSDKGRGVDILTMTATPIPRTLALTAFGDMDVSRLTDKPVGRQPIDTSLIDMNKLEDVIAGIKRQITKGSQVYWVCPLIEESETSDLAAATDRAVLLKQVLGEDKVGLIHGRMKAGEKDDVMEGFASGLVKVLVATTVIEVGVDVPSATVMIVEHAERFGLAQLHQLRGRVGRGFHKSHCLLLYHTPLGETAKARLKMLRDTEDGFKIAEEDLRLRGAGEVLGTRQSGLRAFRIADLSRDSDLLDMAHQDAALILAKDPNLITERGQALRTLLYLFNRDAAVPLLRAG